MTKPLTEAEKRRAQYTKKIGFHVTNDIHKEIKTRSSYRGMSITAWLLLAIEERFAEEDKRK